MFCQVPGNCSRVRDQCQITPDYIGKRDLEVTGEDAAKIVINKFAPYLPFDWVDEVGLRL
jgi:hypothetical protein